MDIVRGEIGGWIELQPPIVGCGLLALESLMITANPRSCVCVCRSTLSPRLGPMPRLWQALAQLGVKFGSSALLAQSENVLPVGVGEDVEDGGVGLGEGNGCWCVE